MDNNDKYIGQLLDNRYEIIEKIGSGGMAIVYKARCHRLNRHVAIKILKDELSGDADFRRRFRTESQAVAMLSHPNIVAVYDVSRSGNIEYIVMELIEGITLKQYINRKGLLNWKEALHFATQVAKALSHAHSRGIVHRDIKPHNIMILKDGSVKVADFGIARLQSMQNTLTQEALGSVHYISPEQAKGSHVDARSDIYSLGVVIYEMLTSHLPFEGDSAVSVAIQHISAIPLMPREINPDIPVGLEAITMHAMEPDLNLRYASTEELLADLEEFRKNPAISFTYFNYDNDTSQATRAMPTGAIAKAESTMIKPIRTPVRNAEMTREEYRKSSKKSSKTSTLVGIFLIILFLVGAVIFIAKVLLPIINPPEEMISIDKFVGQKYTDVLNNPEYQELYTFSKTEAYSDTASAGFITEQNPTAGRPSKKTTKLIEVALTVSLGKQPQNVMPDLVNQNYMNAKISLQQMQLNLDIILEPKKDDAYTPDYVMSTVPNANEPLIEDQTVYIIYCIGPEIVTNEVPDVEGRSIEYATARLEDYDFVPVKGESRYDADVPKDHVISQKPAPGLDAPVKSEVVLTISLGPEEVTPSPSVSPSPSLDPWVSPPPTDVTPPVDVTTSPSPSTSFIP